MTEIYKIYKVVMDVIRENNLSIFNIFSYMLSKRDMQSGFEKLKGTHLFFNLA